MLPWVAGALLKRAKCCVAVGSAGREPLSMVAPLFCWPLGEGEARLRCLILVKKQQARVQMNGKTSVPKVLYKRISSELISQGKD